MQDSILNSTKKVLGIHVDDTNFDADILMHINTVFSALEQLGVGPPGGYMIVDDISEWDDYLLNDYRLNMIKTYMFLRVRLLFDPPTTSFAINAMQEQVKEFEWRINTHREGESWTPPVSTTSSTES